MFFFNKANKFLLYSFIISNLILSLNGCISGNNQARTKINEKKENTKVIRIGYQPASPIVLVENIGDLEKKLTQKGVKVKWKKYNSGPPIIAAMGRGEVDIGYVGDVPALLGQVNNIPLVYVANEIAVPTSMAILVPEDSPIKNLKDLKGKKITLVEGSSAHYTLVQALIIAELTLDDIELVGLPTSEGKIAFKNGEVDVWIGWDPEIADLEEQMSVRMLTNGEGMADHISFYIATRSFVETNYPLMRTFIEEVQKTGQWATENPEEVAKILVEETGLDLATTRRIVSRNIYETLPIQDRAIEEQQRIADIFFRLGIFPKQVIVEKNVWKGSLNEDLDRN